ncbi:hypothetical protein SKAU_G00388280 [Synaphobranchus kaupii]|uniref:TOG domain-containing protein n=1 Tax=Synaphobranchus kaupii TaxID=118154 RepID=A0A9Q1EB21_SYNKA|nr:hypothetical protein SKAU_G00388280 [Synaphobranchus kaupii]
MSKMNGACLPSTSGTDKRNSPRSKAKAVKCQDASTQILVTTQNRATQVDKTLVVCCDKATPMEKCTFRNGIKQGSRTDFNLESSLDADIIRQVLEFSSNEGSPCSVLSSLQTPTAVKSDTTSHGRKYSSPDAMSHKRVGCITSIKRPPKRIDPSHQEANSSLPHSPSLPHSSDKQPIANALKRKTHLKQLELQHMNNPRKALAQGLELLTLEDWEKTITGLNIINSIVQSHPDILVPRLHDICLALILEVMNLRSCVSRVAVSTLGMMYTQLQKKMDPEVELTAVALLQKVGTANEFIRQDIDAALDSMVQNCTATYVIKGLLAGGMRHLNSMVRKCASQRLLNLAERTDAARLLSDTRGITEYILPTAARLAQDPSQEVSETAGVKPKDQSTHTGGPLEALQAVIPLLKDSLAQVVNILVPAIVDNHLNSKISVIHNAADGALNSLIQHLDNALLLEVLCTKAHLLNGKAKGHLIDKLAGMVTGLYSRKPQIVEQKVLPLLWKLLVSSHNKVPTTSLCQALYSQMGQRLRDCVALQSIDVNKALNQLLRTF